MTSPQPGLSQAQTLRLASHPGSGFTELDPDTWRQARLEVLSADYESLD